MSDEASHLERLKNAMIIGREMIETCRDPEWLTAVARRMASGLNYQAMRIVLFEDHKQTLTCLTKEYGASCQIRRLSTEERDNPDDIILWAVEQGIISDHDMNTESGAEILPDARSRLITPIRFEGREIGLIQIESSEENVFDAHDAMILDLMSLQIAMTRDKIRQAALEQKKTEYLALVSEVGRNISGVLTVPDLCSRVTGLIYQHFAYSAIGLFIRDTPRSVLVLQASAGAHSDLFEKEYPLDAGIPGRVLQTGQPHMTNHERRPAHASGDPKRRAMEEAELCVPLRVGDMILGVLDIHNRATDRSFDDIDLLAMDSLAGQVAIALDSARVVQDLQQSVNEQTRLQEQLIQSEKLSALGMLVAGVIHELNNPLTAVIGYADLELMRNPDTVSAENLQRIGQESRRMAQIVRNLLAFARKEKPAREQVHLNLLLHDMVRMRAYHLRSSNIQVLEEYDPSLPSTVGDPNQLRQVFLNIITNAEQAIRRIHSSGVIFISTSSVTRDNSPCILVCIKDNGPGISSSHMSKIFDPFFTTKKTGEGTGLGLSISYGIIQEHEGRLWVESAPDQGAAFYIELPVRSLIPDSSVTSGVETGEAPVAPRRILVIDDEEEIGTYLIGALMRRGHQVDTVTDGAAALRKLDGQSYDLILSDLKMPGMTGFRFYERLKSLYPALLDHLILMTGDVVSPEVQDFLEKARTPYLEKPFTIKQLESAIASIEKGWTSSDTRE